MFGMTDEELIDHHGGPAKLARLLGFQEIGGVQRVQNWRKRGIPPAVKIRFPDLFLDLAKRSPDLPSPQEREAEHG